MREVHPLARASAVLVHLFASRVQWTQLPNGSWRSSGGRVLSDASYQRIQAVAAKAKNAAKKAPTAAPKPTATASATPPAARLPRDPLALPANPKRATIDQVNAALGRRGYSMSGGHTDLKTLTTTYQLTGPDGKTITATADAIRDFAYGKGGPPTGAPTIPPPKPPELPNGMPPPPPPAPADLAYINAAAHKDQARFGPRAAEFLRGALAYTVGALTAGNGAAYGALAGLAVGGPLGLALGTSLGGGLGALAGQKVGTATYNTLGGRGRAAVQLRKAARTVLPKAAGVGVAGPTSVAAGAVLGPFALPVAGEVLDLGDRVAKGTRAALARSTAAKRKAERTNLETPIFAEHFADDPTGQPPKSLDPVALLRARLAAVFARRGEPLPPDADRMVFAGLAMAAMKEEQDQRAAQVAAMSEAVGELTRLSRRLTVHRFAWKEGSRGKRYWLPDGKEDMPANRLYGAKAEKAAAAGRNKQAREAPVGSPERDASEARQTYERAKKNGITGDLLEKLRRRAEGLSNAVAPAAPQQRQAVPLNPSKPTKKAPAKPVTVTVPDAVRAPREPVIARKRTEVRGQPVAATAKGAPPPKAPPVATVKLPEPAADGTPQLEALKNAVDAGAVPKRGLGWTYDFTNARAALAGASTQIDGFVKAKPAAAVTLAKEVTGHTPKDPADAAALLKAWVGETISLLNREPSELDRKRGRSTGFSERAMWFAEARPRCLLVEKLLAALSA